MPKVTANDVVMVASTTDKGDLICVEIGDGPLEVFVDLTPEKAAEWAFRLTQAVDRARGQGRWTMTRALNTTDYMVALMAGACYCALHCADPPRTSLPSGNRCGLCIAAAFREVENASLVRVAVLEGALRAVEQRHREAGICNAHSLATCPCCGCIARAALATTGGM